MPPLGDAHRQGVINQEQADHQRAEADQREADLHAVQDALSRLNLLVGWLDNGLPAQLVSSINFYTQQFLVSQSLSATYTLIGVRNTLAFTVFRAKTEVLAGSSASQLPFDLAFNANNTQRGGSVVFSHQLSAFTNMILTATRLNATADVASGGKSTQSFLQFIAQTRLSPKTDAFTGARYSIFDSDFGTDYREAAIFVGVNHRF